MRTNDYQHLIFEDPSPVCVVAIKPHLARRLADQQPKPMDQAVADQFTFATDGKKAPVKLVEPAKSRTINIDDWRSGPPPHDGLWLTLLSTIGLRKHLRGFWYGLDDGDLIPQRIGENVLWGRPATAAETGETAKAAPQAEEWHEGAPPHVGWYVASRFKRGDRFRYWDGALWSGDSLCGGLYKIEHSPSDFTHQVHWLRPATPAEIGAPEADADGWIAWAGGECPVAADVVVAVRLNGGGESGFLSAGKWRWQKNAGITHYRLARGAAA